MTQQVKPKLIATAINTLSKETNTFELTLSTTVGDILKANMEHEQRKFFVSDSDGPEDQD